MLFYKHQLIYLTNRKEPAIFLGVDEKNQYRFWVYRLDGQGKGKVDDFYESNIDYIRKEFKSSKNEACPTTGSVIFWGKYSKPILFPTHNTSKNIIPDNEETLIKYLSSLSFSK